MIDYLFPDPLGMVWELNRPDVTRMVPRLPQLILLGTRRGIGRTNRRTGRQERVMPVSRGPVIGEGV